MECKKPDIGFHLIYRPFVQPMDKPTFSRFPHRRPLESSKHVTHCRPSSSLYIPISASFLGPDLQSYQFCKGYWTWMTPINSQRPMHSWYRTRNQHSYFWINSLSYKQNYWNKNKQKKISTSQGGYLQVPLIEEVKLKPRCSISSQYVWVGLV